jgi:hypothetical protein
MVLGETAMMGTADNPASAPHCTASLAISAMSHAEGNARRRRRFDRKTKDMIMTNSSDAVSHAEATNLLLASNKVDGTKVSTRDGDALGTVYSLMIHKRTGVSTYAVLSLGGFLGIGKSYYPLPFELLSYDHVADGYVVTLDRRLLEGGPSWSNNAPDFNQAYADRVSNYYGVIPADLSVV